MSDELPKFNPYTNAVDPPVAIAEGVAPSGHRVVSARPTTGENDMTTFAVLPVNPTTYGEIREKLLASGYDHAVKTVSGVETLDMRELGLQSVEIGRNPVEVFVELMVEAGYKFSSSETTALGRMHTYAEQQVNADITKGEQPNSADGYTTLDALLDESGIREECEVEARRLNNEG